MIRLFIALGINEEVQNKFNTIISDFKSNQAQVKWVDSHNLHLTLKFLGNTDPKEVKIISNLLLDISKDYQAIESCFNSLGGFPNLNKPKVIWTDLEDNKDSIIDLAQAIDLSCTKSGFEKDNKPFKPHLTLGRVKSYEGLTQLTSYLQKYTFEPIPIVFNRLQLIKSTLTQEGPIYKVLSELELSERFSG